MASSCAWVMGGVSSGVGKTSLSLGLVRALSRKGTDVQTFKVGPDYLDPTYLALASNRVCYNLDDWMMGEAHVRDLYDRHPATVRLVEGVMGLFDGADPGRLDGSTAQAALLLGLPVVLVVDASSMAGSIAALVKGYVEFCPDLTIAGIVANRVGSDRHTEIVRDALRLAHLPPLLGAIPRKAFPSLPSRHLGLVSATRDLLPLEMLDALADACERHIDLDALLAATTVSEQRMHALSDGVSPMEYSVRVAYAFDEAFHFYYPENLHALERAGAELVSFSPLTDTRLPDDVAGVILGGGYPEEHAQGLAQNTTMKNSLSEFAEQGGLIYAECGGLMYLADWFEDREGSRYPMCGIFPVGTRLLARRKRLGLVEVRAEAPTPWLSPGERMRGHEFHYSEMIGESPPEWIETYAISYRRNDQVACEGWMCGNVFASYVHLYWGARSDAVRRFLHHCRVAR